jgi:hypothetical protein
MKKQASVALVQTPDGSLNDFVKDLVEILGVKAKTAEQILKNVPLKVYNKLDYGSARILVEALNVMTKLDWVMVSSEDDTPAVNWNKPPKLKGMTLEDLVKKNHPKKTGVANFFPELAPEIAAGQDSMSRVVSDPPDQTILKTADSVIRHLNEDLEAAFKNKVVDKRKEAPAPDESLPAFDTDSQNIPGVNQHAKLEAGFYNLFLPLLKGKQQRHLAEKLCHDILKWGAKEIKENLAKPIVCIAREVDDIDAIRLIESFKKGGLSVNAKLRKRL